MTVDLAQFLPAIIVITGISTLICCVRFVAGPTNADRVIAADTIVTHVIALLVLHCMRSGSAVYYDSVLVLTILGFVGTFTFAKYLVGQGNILDYNDER